MQPIKHKTTQGPTGLYELFLLTVPNEEVARWQYIKQFWLYSLNLQTITITLDVVKWRWGGCTAQIIFKCTKSGTYSSQTFRIIRILGYSTAALITNNYDWKCLHICQDSKITATGFAHHTSSRSTAITRYKLYNINTIEIAYTMFTT